MMCSAKGEELSIRATMTLGHKKAVQELSSELDENFQREYVKLSAGVVSSIIGHHVFVK